MFREDAHNKALSGKAGWLKRLARCRSTSVLTCAWVCLMWACEWRWEARMCVRLPVKMMDMAFHGLTIAWQLTPMTRPPPAAHTHTHRYILKHIHKHSSHVEHTLSLGVPWTQYHSQQLTRGAQTIPTWDWKQKNVCLCVCVPTGKSASGHRVAVIVASSAPWLLPAVSLWLCRQQTWVNICRWQLAFKKSFFTYK